MKIAVTVSFRQDYDDLPTQIRKKVDRQVNYLRRVGPHDKTLNNP